jgi:hypothetical protein
MIDYPPATDLLGEGSLNQSQIDVPGVVESAWNARRVIQRRAQMAFSDPARGGFSNQHVPVDRPIA